MARTVRPKVEKPSVAPKPAVKPLDPKVYARNKRSVFLIMLAIPLITVSSYVLYKRVILGQPKRVQQGEYTPDGGLRVFNAEEKALRDSKSWSTWLFGKEQ